MKPLRLLYVTDQASAHAADTLRGLQSAHGMTVATIDIRGFAGQNTQDPAAFTELNRQNWLLKNAALAFERFARADVHFVDSGQFALAWMSQAGFAKRLVARICLDDCERPGLHLVDWSAVHLLVFTDGLTRSTFEKNFPGRIPRSRTCIIPLHLSAEHFVDAGPGGQSIRLAGNPALEPGLATALQIASRTSRGLTTTRLVVDDFSAQGQTLAARRSDLITDERVAGDGVTIGTEPAADSSEPAYGVVLCASPTLAAAHAVLLHAARGAQPLLRRNRTCAQSWLAGHAKLYSNLDEALAFAAEADLSGRARASERLRALKAVCGERALADLATALRRPSRLRGARLFRFARIKRWFIKRLKR